MSRRFIDYFIRGWRRLNRFEHQAKEASRLQFKIFPVIRFPISDFSENIKSKTISLSVSSVKSIFEKKI